MSESKNPEQKIICSVPLLTLNCAEKLERCLNSIQAIDDLIVFDGNSTDGTQAVAQKFGARIFKQYDTNEPNVRIKDFTEVRGRAWAEAKNDWLFLIDADEWASPELMIEVREAINTNNKNTVYLIERRALVEGKEIKHAFFCPDLIPRLFAKSSGIHLKPGKTVHERLIIPPQLKIKRLAGCAYTDWPTYAEAIKKDDWYIANEVTSHANYPIKSWFYWTLLHDNIRLVYMVAKIFWSYLRFGFKNNLPLRWSWRFVRYEAKLGLAITKIVFTRFFKKI